MITKKQFCEIVVDDFCRSNNLESPTMLNDSHIAQSSSLAVCMEHLGLIKSEVGKEYASSRGGILYTHVNFKTKDVNILSTRELLDLLPENI